jgi:hypothetical protein
MARDRNDNDMPNGETPGSMRDAGFGRGGHGASQSDFRRGYLDVGSPREGIEETGNGERSSASRFGGQVYNPQTGELEDEPGFLPRNSGYPNER